MNRIVKLFNDNQISSYLLLTGLLAGLVMAVMIVTGVRALAFSQPNSSYTWHDLKNSGIPNSTIQTGSLVFNNDIPYIVTFDQASYGRDVNIMKYSGGGWVQVGDTINRTSGSGDVSLVFDGSIPYVVIADVLDSGSTRTKTVKKFDGSHWIDIGSTLTTGDNSISLAFVGDVPYIAYTDKTTGTAMMSKFDGSDWVSVGGSISTGDASDEALATDGVTPYVAYRDQDSGWNVVVKKFNGSNWVSVGGLASVDDADELSLVINDGTPYLAFLDGNNNYVPIVLSYDGTGWVRLGSANPFDSDGDGGISSLVFSGDTPYLAYVDVYGAIIKKYDGSNWQDVGNSVPTYGSYYVSLALKGSTPYLAFNLAGDDSSSIVVRRNISNQAVLSIAGGNTTVVSPLGTNMTNATSSKESSQAVQDEGYSYPTGLIDFTFDGASSSNSVTLTFITDAKPSNVTLRKYDPTTKRYSTIKDAKITQTEVDGKAALKATYTIIDNGPLDLDKTIGVVRDPVGLAVAGGVGAPDTGFSNLRVNDWRALLLTGAGALAFIGMVSILRRRGHLSR